MANNFKLDISKAKKDNDKTTIMYRIPIRQIKALNHQIKNSGLSGQQLIEQMVDHCLGTGVK